MSASVLAQTRPSGACFWAKLVSQIRPSFPHGRPFRVQRPHGTLAYARVLSKRVPSA